MSFADYPKNTHSVIVEYINVLHYILFSTGLFDKLSWSQITNCVPNDYFVWYEICLLKNTFIVIQSIPFFLFKALEDGGKYHFYSKKFSECTKYAEMICKHFEKNCTGSEMKKNTFHHLEFALTWPTMSYVLTMQCMLYFLSFLLFLAHKVIFVLVKMKHQHIIVNFPL